MKILILHKNEFLCRQWVKRLKASGHDCYFATKVDRAWKAVVDRKVDMVISEPNLTNAHGIKLLERINRLGTAKPDVLLLDSMEKMKRVKSEKKNMDDLFELDEVLETIAHFAYVRESKEVA